MGGSFNPPHFGHINSLQTVRKQFLLDWIYVVPAFKPPLSRPIKETIPSQRVKMLKAAFQNSPFIKVDEREIHRKETSYSYITVEGIARQWEKAELFFILGLDQFQIWDQWKNSRKILAKSHLIVTSRSGKEFPSSKETLPKTLQQEVSSFSLELVTLKNKKTIYFCQLKDKNISSTLVREKLKKGVSPHSLIPPSVFNYINKKRFYYSVNSLSSQAPDKQSEKLPLFGFISNRLKNLGSLRKEKPLKQDQHINRKASFKTSPELKTASKMIPFCCKVLQSKQAFHLKLYDFSHIPNRPFYFVLVASSLHPPHSKILARYLEKQIQKAFSLSPFGKEGEREGQWIALDYNTLGIHIFYDYSREKYGFDKIWSDFLAVPV